MRFDFLLPIASLQSVYSAQLKPCYKIDGDPISQIPCDPSADVSACCWLGGVCLTNFRCHGHDGYDRVGTCTDKTGNDPACPPPFLRDPTVWNWFGYTQNTTDCGDGTFCMNPGNETCCLNRDGIKEITYHNNATIPTIAEGWTTYYEDAGYSLPTTTSDPSTSRLSISLSISNSFASTTPPVQSQSTNDTRPSSSQQPTLANATSPTHTSTTTSKISPGEKAIIATAGVVGALAILGAVTSLYLFRRSRTRRSKESEQKPRAELSRVNDTAFSEHTVPRELNATGDRPLNELDLGGLHELVGQNEREARVELSA